VHAQHGQEDQGEEIKTQDAGLDGAHDVADNLL
jgi:hypothetical protein